MAWQAGVAQPVPLVCYLAGEATAPTAPITTEVNVEGDGYATATNDATIEGDDGEVAVLLDADEMGAWGFVRVEGANGAIGIQPFTSEGDYTAARAGQLDNLDAAVSSRVATADVAQVALDAEGRVDMGAVGGTAVTGPDDLKADVSNLDATVSSRSSHSAADVASAVWAAGTRTLTGFGTLVADIATAVWGAAARTLTAFGFTPSANVTQVAGSAVEGVNDFKADVSALALEATVGALNDLSSADAQAAATAALNAYDPPTKAELDAAVLPLALEATLTAIKGVGWTTETLVALDAAIEAIGSGAGSGSRTMVFALSDGAGTLAGGVKTHVENGDGDLVAGPVATTSSGIVTFYLDDGDYELVSASTAMWQGNSKSVTVTESASVAVTLTAQTLPAPSSPDKFTIIINATDEHDDPVGAAERTYRILSLYPLNDAAANLIRAIERNPITTDGNGQASFEIGRTVQGGEIEEAWSDAASMPTTEVHRFEVDAAKADPHGRMYLADIRVD